MSCDGEYCRASMIGERDSARHADFGRAISIVSVPVDDDRYLPGVAVASILAVFEGFQLRLNLKESV